MMQYTIWIILATYWIIFSSIQFSNTQHEVSKEVVGYVKTSAASRC